MPAPQGVPSDSHGGSFVDVGGGVFVRGGSGVVKRITRNVRAWAPREGEESLILELKLLH